MLKGGNHKKYAYYKRREHKVAEIKHKMKCFPYKKKGGVGGNQMRRKKKGE